MQDNLLRISPLAHKIAVSQSYQLQIFKKSWDWSEELFVRSAICRRNISQALNVFYLSIGEVRIASRLPSSFTRLRQKSNPFQGILSNSAAFLDPF